MSNIMMKAVVTSLITVVVGLGLGRLVLNIPITFNKSLSLLVIVLLINVCAHLVISRLKLL